jgi:hypothetical protein
MLMGQLHGSDIFLINASPTRAQLAAVSEIKNLFVGLARLILAPQLEH